MALHNITTRKEFEDKVLQSNKVVLVDFWAAWCPPCRAMAPSLHDIADELDDVLDVVKINLEESDENKSLAGEYEVQSIPNMPIFKDGKEVERIIGMVPKSYMKELVGKLA